MSGNLPTSQGFQVMNFKSERPTLVSKSVSGKRFSRQVASQFFSFSLRFPKLQRSDFAELFAFVVKQRSQKETFNVVLPTISKPRGTISGTITATATAGSTSVTLSGGSGTMKSGDLVRFANHDKVYMVVSDNSDVSSNALVIEPELRSSLSSTNMTYDDVPFSVNMVNDVQEFTTGTSGFFDFEIDCAEDL